MTDDIPEEIRRHLARQRTHQATPIPPAHERPPTIAEIEATPGYQRSKLIAAVNRDPTLAEDERARRVAELQAASDNRIAKLAKES